MNDEQKYRSEYYRYSAGFIGALLLTYLVYFSATGHWLGGMWLGALLLLAALAQTVLQLVVFLHIGNKKGPRWTLWSTAYMVFMVLIVVLASIWIMTNMNYNMHMSPEHMEEYMLEQNSKGF